MKKVYLLMVLVFVMAMSAQAVNVISNGSFETGDATDWWTEVSGTASVAIDDTMASDGTYSFLATAAGAAWAEEAQFGQYFEFEASVAGDELTLFFDYYATSGDVVGVNFDYYTDAKHWLGWTEFTPVVGEWTTVEITYALPVGTYALDLKVEVTGESHINFDNFTTDPTVLIPSPVTLVSPENNDPIVALDADLTWTVDDPNVTTVDLYLGAEGEPNLTLIPLHLEPDIPATTTSYSPTLVNSTTYYWKVVAHEPNTLGGPDILTDSAVWRFTTVGPSPLIQSITPKGQSVLGDGSADATITVAGLNFENFLWKKDGSELTDTVKYSGLDSEALTINDVTIDDEGVYSCEVSNTDPGTEPDVASAVVVTERLISWWKLDGDLSDSVLEIEPDADFVFDGVVNPDTEFTIDDSGIDGGNSLALAIDDPNCPIVPIAGTEDFFNFYEDTFTASAWIRTGYVNGSVWPAVVSKGPQAGTGYFVALDGESEVVTEVDGTRIYTDGPVVADGQWHMVSLTFDGSVQRIYVDGVLQATSDVTAADASANTAPVVLAAWDLGSPDADFEGNIDDVKIYSYALTTTEVALEYVATNPSVDYVCNQELPALSYDFDDNCRVDLADFAGFAGEWLKCNRIPAMECN